MRANEVTVVEQPAPGRVGHAKLNAGIRQRNALLADEVDAVLGIERLQAKLQRRALSALDAADRGLLERAQAHVHARDGVRPQRRGHHRLLLRDHPSLRLLKASLRLPAIRERGEGRDGDQQHATD